MIFFNVSKQSLETFGKGDLFESMGWGGGLLKTSKDIDIRQTNA